MQELEARRGYYEPTFFRMHIDTVNPLDFSRFTPDEQSTFVHEYMHFLQDFTTLYGLNQAYQRVEYVREYVNMITDRRKTTLPVKGTMPALRGMKIISNETFGTPGNIQEIDRVLLVEEKHVDLDADLLKLHEGLKNFRKVFVTVQPKGGKIIKVEFGALCVLEGMAKLTQRIITPAVSRQPPHYPYEMVRLIADYYCKTKKNEVVNLADNFEVLFALCDVALQSTLPGPAFFSYLKTAADRGITNANDIYNLFFKAFEEWDNPDQWSICNLAREHLLSYVKDELEARYRAWIENILCYAHDMRVTRPTFLLDMVRGGIAPGSLFEQIVAQLGTPLMSNLHGIWGKIPASISGAYAVDFDVEFFRAVRYINDLLANGRVECPLQEWCRRSPEVRGMVDAACVVNPPAHCDPTNYGGRLCPVGALWRHWGLDDYRLKAPTLFRPVCK